MIKALAITGPTASGKTSLSLSVAEMLGCEIISCDSMQIYRGMDIGTAKATAEEQARVPHHLIDILPPTEPYSAEQYRADAINSAKAISERGKIPLFVGGTGLYIDTVMRGGELSSPPSDPVLSERLRTIGSTEEGREKLWGRLNEIDPLSAEKTHKNNVRRVARAIEIFELTGKTKSYFDLLSTKDESEISVAMLTLDCHDRELLYRRVNERVDVMMSEGLLCEARRLFESGFLDRKYTCSQAIGYKEMLSFLLGEGTLEEAVEQLKQSSRRYAKRQLTWFRREKNAYRLYLDREDGTLVSTEELCKEATEFFLTYLNTK